MFNNRFITEQCCFTPMFSVLILVMWLCTNGGKQGVILSKRPADQLNATQELCVKGSRIAPFVSKEKAVADAACTVLLTCTCSSLARKLFCLFPNKKRDSYNVSDCLQGQNKENLEKEPKSFGCLFLPLPAVWVSQE